MNIAIRYASISPNDATGGIIARVKAETLNDLQIEIEKLRQIKRS